MQKTRDVTFLCGLLSSFAAADTLTLKDGTQHTGTLVSARSPVLASAKAREFIATCGRRSNRSTLLQ
jgi:hypothetical protein